MGKEGSVVGAEWLAALWGGCRWSTDADSRHCDVFGKGGRGTGSSVVVTRRGRVTEGWGCCRCESVKNEFLVCGSVQSQLTAPGCACVEAWRRGYVKVWLFQGTVAPGSLLPRAGGSAR